MKRFPLFLCLILLFLGNILFVGCRDNQNELETSAYYYFAEDDSIGKGFVYNEDDTTSFINQAAEFLWNEMLSLASPNGRQEVGCYIYKNSDTGEEILGSLKYGPSVSGDVGTNGSILPGPGQPSRNGITGDDAYLWVPIGFIHTHTTLKYEHDCERECGPSASDEDWARKNGTTIYTVDFIGVNRGDGHNFIHAGEEGGFMVYTSNFSNRD